MSDPQTRSNRVVSALGSGLGRRPRPARPTAPFCPLLGLSLAILLAALLMTGCATVHLHNDGFAGRHGLERVEVRGVGFTHVAYVKPGGRGDLWHVYLEGDGLPWVARVFVNPDPAVREPLMLRLATRDPAPLVYLGRPCYHGVSADTGCESWAWTEGRHAESVVTSLVAALERLRERHRIGQIALIGHSGGGALAMLMAPRLPAVAAVMTVAGNLDLAGWTRLHRYSPLTGSLDPALQPALPASIAQLHFAGAEDDNVPPVLTEATVLRQPCAAWQVLGGVGHVDGWDRHWPILLAALREAVARPDCAPQGSVETGQR